MQRSTQNGIRRTNSGDWAAIRNGKLVQSFRTDGTSRGDKRAKRAATIQARTDKVLA